MLINLALFLLQTACITAAIFGALRLGKEALVTLFALMAILANLFVIQQIELGGLNATSSDAFAVGALFCLNLIQKFHGKDLAKKTVWISFLAMLFFVAVSQIHLLFHPSPLDTSRPHFDAVLSSSPRLLIASLATFFIVQWIDLYLFARFRRMGMTLFISQAIDTALFTFLGLYGLVGELAHIMVVSYTIKCAAILLTILFFKPLKAADEV
jgi:queuosine precursor transporter